MAEDEPQGADESTERDPDLDEHPGAPRPRDEIDPELISLRKMRVSAGPLLSLAIIVFSGYIMVQLLPDLRFSRQSESARSVDDVSKVGNREGYGPEEFVLMRALPDRSFAVLVAPSGTTDGHRMAPVQGTNGKVWMMVEGEPWVDPPAYDDVYRGRLRELDDMPFAESLRAYVRDAGAMPQSVDSAALREALAGKKDQVVRPSGDGVAISADTPVAISETVAGKALVRAFVRPDRLPDHAAWSAKLVAAGVLPAGAEPVSESDQEIRYHVPAPEGIEGVKARIAAAQLFAARTEPLMRDHTSTWGQLRVEGDGVAVGGQRVPWSSISAVVVQAPRTLPDDAMVFITDEDPGAYWYMLPLYIVLGLFVVLFAWALLRALLPEKVSAGAGEEARSAA